MKKYIVFILILTFPLIADAQRWKKNRWDLTGGLGTSNFFGDLGGSAEEVASHFGPKDIDFKSTRPIMSLGLRYKIYEMVSLKLGGSYGMISASDELSGHIGRQSRNLHFRSQLGEIAMQVEYYFVKERVGSRYAISHGGIRDMISSYIFIGFGGIVFSPQGYYEPNDDFRTLLAQYGVQDNVAEGWVALRPLYTEGQGMPDIDNNIKQERRTKQYGMLAGTIPLGIGVKYAFNKEYSIGLEIGVRYTTSDYIDDASNQYYSYWEAIETGVLQPADVSPAQLFFSDHHLIVDYDTNTIIGEPYSENWKPYSTGKTRRGSPDYNDAYAFMLITLSYKLRTTRSGLPKLLK